MSLEISCQECGKPFRADAAQATDSIACPFCGLEAVASAVPVKSARRTARVNWQWITAASGLSLSVVVAAACGLALPTNQHKPIWEQDLPIPLVDAGDIVSSSEQAIEAGTKEEARPEPNVAKKAEEFVGPRPLENVNTPVGPVNLALLRQLQQERLRGLDDEPVEEAAKRVKIKRRVRRTEEDLRKDLVMVREMGVRDVPLRSMQILVNAPKNRRYREDERPNFAGLPMRMGIDCQIGKEPADHMQTMSRKVRESLAASMRGGAVVDTDRMRDLLSTGAASDPRLRGLGAALAAAGRQIPEDIKTDRLSEWLRPEAVPTLNQMLMPESKDVRLLLVELLDQIKGREASEALVQRALFDLSSEVREEAVNALNKRPREEYRDKLLEGFRYPWAPAADHAAETLVAINDSQAVSQLLNLLEKPSPKQPFVRMSDRMLVTREVVRVNHLANCVMCHARASADTDPVPGRIPNPKMPLPPLVQYYDSPGNGIFVRADVTYLKQDFSVPQPVEKHGPWPANQRFDYMVRTRPLTNAEISYLRAKRLEQERLLAQLGNKASPVPEPRYEQRDAVLFALRELTGRDAGVSTLGWHKLYGKPLNR